MNDFVFLVEDVFFISGRGMVVTGRVAEGNIYLHQTAYVQQPDGTLVETTVSQIESFRTQHDIATEGGNYGLLLRGLERHEVQRGYYVIGRLPDGYTATSTRNMPSMSWFRKLFS